MPWKPRGASCCTSSETGGRSRGSWGCLSEPARRRGPPERPPRSWCPVLTLGAPGWPWPRCCLQSYCRGRTWRAAWTVWWWAALREYASQQLGSVPPDWVVSEEQDSLGEKQFSFFFCLFSSRRGWSQEPTRKSAKDGGKSALQVWAKRVWTETLNSDDYVRYHQHRMCQPEKHQVSFFFTDLSKSLQYRAQSLTARSVFMSVLWSVAHLMDTFSRVYIIYEHHKLPELHSEISQ